MKLWLGIDIGATNTRAFVWNPADSTISLLNCDSGDSLPSTVAIDFDRDGEVIVGEQARRSFNRIS